MHPEKYGWYWNKILMNNSHFSSVNSLANKQLILRFQQANWIVQIEVKFENTKCASKPHNVFQGWHIFTFQIAQTRFYETCWCVSVLLRQTYCFCPKNLNKFAHRTRAGILLMKLYEGYLIILPNAKRMNYTRIGF